MSIKAQAVLEEIRLLSPAEIQTVWQELQRWLTAESECSQSSDPILSTRGMFAGSRLTDALLASRAEDVRNG